MTETCRLIEDGKRVTHATVGLFGNDGKCFFLIGDAFFVGNRLQMRNRIAHRHALEVVDLAARKDGRKNFMLLCGGQDEDDMGGRFLKGLQKSIESSRRKHVHLVDDKHLIATHLRRYSRLFHQRFDVLHRVVAGRIKLEYVVRTLLIESLTAFTGIAGLAVFARIFTVNGLRKDASTSGFPYTSRATEQVSMRQFPAFYRILQRCCERMLAHNGVESHRAILPCRYNIIFHFF